MDRTARMLRRTLLCAVFTCPAALLSLNAALLLHVLWTALLVLPVRARPPLWHAGLRRRPQPRRVGFALCVSCFFAALTHAALRPLFSAGALRLLPALRVLCALSAALTQGELLARVRQADRRHAAAGLLAALFFIFCMR